MRNFLIGKGQIVACRADCEKIARGPKCLDSSNRSTVRVLLILRWRADRANGEAISRNRANVKAIEGVNETQPRSCVE